MKTSIFSTFVIALLSIGISQGQTTRTLGSFDMITVAGSISVDIVSSSESKAEITILKGEEEALITELNGKELMIKFAKADGYNWGSGAKANITLYTNTLQGVSAAAGAKVESDHNWASKKLTVEASSGSSVSLKADVNVCNAQSSSGSRVTLSGRAESMTASTSSGSSLNATEMQATQVQATSSSGGSLKVNATSSLRAEASSGGSIKYKGSPKDLNIDKDQFSGGNVSPM